MRQEFRLADIGEGLEEAEIIKWLVSVGDHVSRDQPLIEVMTDKSNAELPAPAEGTVVELAGAVGDILLVGELIAVIEAADTEPAPTPPPPEVLSPSAVTPRAVTPVARPSDTASAVTPSDTPAGASSTSGAAPPRIERSLPMPSSPSAQPADTAPVPEGAASPSARVKAAPSTRRAAVERGIDLSTITGTGPGGRILLTDLDDADTAVAPDPLPAARTPEPAERPGSVVDIADVAASTATPATTGTSTTSPLRGVRRAVARNMAQSWSEIPHIHAFEHIDAEPLLEVRTRLRETGRAAYESLTPLAFFVAAVAKALGENPDANASIDMAAETITHHSRINVGVAVASEQGLVVPVLQAADQLDFETLSLTLTQLVQGARDGQLSREHFLGGTVTITNFGSLGGEQAAPLIRPPEAMILGFGSIAERPFVIEGEVVARKTLNLVAGADHRLLDGDTTTAVLAAIARSLSDPLELVI